AQPSAQTVALRANAPRSLSGVSTTRLIGRACQACAPSRRGPFATCQVSPSRSCPRADQGGSRLDGSPRHYRPPGSSRAPQSSQESLLLNEIRARARFPCPPRTHLPPVGHPTPPAPPTPPALMPRLPELNERGSLTDRCGR